MSGQIPGSKLMEIAEDIGNKDAMKIASKGGLEKLQFKNVDLECYTVLTEIMANTSPRNQKRRLRQILIDCNHRAAADKYLPMRVTRKTGGKAAPKTNLPMKRELDEPTLPTKDATPAKKKPTTESKLEAERKKCREIKTALNDFNKEQKRIAKEIKQKNQELKKSNQVIKKLVEREIKNEEKKLEKHKKEHKKLSSSGGSASQESTSN